MNVALSAATSIADQAPGRAGLIARGAELHQQLLARELHRRELLEPRP